MQDDTTCSVTVLLKNLDRTLCWLQRVLKEGRFIKTTCFYKMCTILNELNQQNLSSASKTNAKKLLFYYYYSCLGSKLQLTEFPTSITYTKNSRGITLLSKIVLKRLKGHENSCRSLKKKRKKCNHTLKLAFPLHFEESSYPVWRYSSITYRKKVSHFKHLKLFINLNILQTFQYRVYIYICTNIHP